MLPKPTLTQLTFVVAAALILPALAVAISPTMLGGGTLMVPNTFVAGAPARASEVNENFMAVESAYAELEGRVLERNPTEIRVAAVGGDFTSVAAALDSIVTSSSSERFVVRVAPGVYQESALMIMPPFVRLVGAGREVTELRSMRSASSQNADAAALVMSSDNAVEDLTLPQRGGCQRSLGRDPDRQRRQHRRGASYPRRRRGQRR